MHFKAAQLPQRDRKDPQVQRDAHGSVGPAYGIGIGARALMHAVPLCPEVVHRSALEDGRYDKGKAPGRHKSKRAPENTLDVLCREDAHVKGHERQLQKGGLQEVQPRHDVEEFADIGDLRWRQGPDIPAEAVGNGAEFGDDGAGDGGDHRCEDKDIVET